MRILQIPNTSAPAPAGIPAPDLGRVEAIERIAKSILQRIQDIEERIKALEESPKTSSSPAAVSGGSISLSGPPTETFGGDVKNGPSITMDTDSLKKDLFAKMWKYLNDKAAA